jgi:hypothetical protein
MCKWLVNHSGRLLSAGWKRFAVDHLLEEGDVCVFEMIDRVNLTLLIHIFRIELGDHVSEPIEVRKSEESITSADPAKRKRKSRAKPKGLGPPVPKLPAYSGCRMEKLGGSNSPLRGANVLPNMPSYKYTALQSRRRPVTMEERRRAELGARNLNTKNPSVTVVMRNSSVYCHFLVVGQALNLRCWERNEHSCHLDPPYATCASPKQISFWADFEGLMTGEPLSYWIDFYRDHVKTKK